MVAGNCYDRFRVSPHDPATLRCGDVEACLRELAAASVGRLEVVKFAESVERRPIYLATLGRGPRRVLLWSQMHGDEPTHTAVLLDLLSYLVQSPPEPLAEEVLSGCTLWMIPMLNPDGANAMTRFNAQHVDINRDSRRLQTPEGRALLRAAQTVQPAFALNLHNQNARTSVGNPPRPTAVAVMAPPLDEHCTETAQIRSGKQIAACVVDAVRQRIDGVVSRYEAEYMPQAFGEAIQATGAVTVLIEAGGWPEADPTPLVELHFHGLLAALHAIATDHYSDVDPGIYDSLPRANEQRLVDCAIQGGHVCDGPSGAPFRADVGINFPDGHRVLPVRKSHGRIVDMGDLSVTAGKESIDAGGCLVLPGRVAFAGDLKPGMVLSADKLGSFLASGATTIIGRVDLDDRDAVESLCRVDSLPINVGFVAGLGTSWDGSNNELIERVLWAVTRGVLAVVDDRFDVVVRRRLEKVGVPLLRRAQLPSPTVAVCTFRELAENIRQQHELLELNADRGGIRRDFFADLQLFELGGEMDVSAAVDGRRLRRVMVAGRTVWSDGSATGDAPGQLLRRSAVACQRPSGR